tara:strand:- start:448 stop:651 length:204 start_codon:yes stop_codon:yes gene_type:complete
LHLLLSHLLLKEGSMVELRITLLRERNESGLINIGEGGTGLQILSSHGSIHIIGNVEYHRITLEVSP